MYLDTCIKDSSLSGEGRKVEIVVDTEKDIEILSLNSPASFGSPWTCSIPFSLPFSRKILGLCVSLGFTKLRTVFVFLDNSVGSCDLYLNRSIVRRLPTERLNAPEVSLGGPSSTHTYLSCTCIYAHR